MGFSGSKAEVNVMYITCKYNIQLQQKMALCSPFLELRKLRSRYNKQLKFELGSQNLSNYKFRAWQNSCLLTMPETGKKGAEQENYLSYKQAYNRSRAHVVSNAPEIPDNILQSAFDVLKTIFRIKPYAVVKINQKLITLS